MTNDRSSEARDEERRLGPAVEPWVELAVVNQWNGGPTAALRDAAALRGRAEQTRDQFWQLTAALKEATILGTLIGQGQPPHDEADDVARIRHILDRSEAVGQPSAIASALTSLGTALRTSRPDEALYLLEKALDISAPLDIEVTSARARAELASLYTQLGRPIEALMLARDTIPFCLRSGAWHEVWPALTHIARALADAGAPRVAALVLGRLDAELDLLGRDRQDFHALHAQLLAALGEAEFDSLLDDGRTLPIADLAQFAVETIDELTN